MGGKYVGRGEGVVKKYFQYLKIVLVLLLLVFVILDLKGEDISSAKLEDVAGAVVKAADISEKPAENRMIKRFYGLNPKDFEGAVLYAPTDNMDANELFIVRLSDMSQSQAVEEAIEERLQTQKKSFEGYGAEQTKLLNDHILQVKGNYIFYMVGENASKAEKAFLNNL
ncbi:MAG: DUF4358 domain-containing protein [Hespellia sp.]|nr:DUF4358 domain-containing protein [Hespellia sp.]